MRQSAACGLFMALGLGGFEANAQVAVSGSNPFPTLPFAARLVSGDFDKDGDVDILYQSGNTSGAGWNYMQNNGNGTYTTIAASGTGTFSSGPFNGITFTQFASMFVVDYDKDGDFDLLDNQNNASRLLVNNGNGTFSVSGSNPFPTLPFASRISFNDFDNDGDTDALYQSGNTSGAGWNYMQNNGNGTYTTIAASGTGTFSSGPFNGITFTQFTAIFGLDYDRDGDLDLIDNQNSSSRLLVYNAGVYTVSGSNPFPVLPFATRLSLVDADSDGDVDVLYQASNTSGAGWNYMQNNGNGTYTTIAASGTGTFSSGPFNGITFTQFASVFIFDYEKDGDLDILDNQNNASRLLTQTNTPPRLLTSTPSNNAMNAVRDGNIVLNFSEAVVAGTGNIYIRRTSDNSIFETIAANGARVTGTGTSTVNVNPVGILSSNTSYYVTFDNTAFRDASGAAFGVLTPGSLAISSITSNTFLTFTTSTILPVRVLSFTATRQAGGVGVQWQTSNESAIDHYEVEYSLDGIHFSSLDRQAAVNTVSGRTYTYVHPSPVAGTQYYRLAVYEQSGEKSYLPVVVIRIEDLKNPIRLYPVPAVSSINARFTSGRYTRVQLVDVTGRILASQTVGQSTETVTFPVQGYGSGVYYLRFISTAGTEVQSFNKN